MGEKEGGIGLEKRGCVTNITPPSQVGRILVVATQTRTTKTHKASIVALPPNLSTNEIRLEKDAIHSSTCIIPFTY